MSNLHVPICPTFQLLPGTINWTPQSIEVPTSPFCVTHDPDPKTTFVVQKQVGKNFIFESQIGLNPSCPCPDSDILFLSKSGGTSPPEPTVFGDSVNPDSRKLAPKSPAKILAPKIPSKFCEESIPAVSLAEPTTVPTLDISTMSTKLKELDYVNGAMGGGIMDAIDLYDCELDTADDAIRVFINYAALIDTVCLPPRLVSTSHLRSLCKDGVKNLCRLFKALGGPLPLHWCPCPGAVFPPKTMDSLRNIFKIARDSVVALATLPPYVASPSVAHLDLPIDFAMSLAPTLAIIDPPFLVVPLSFTLVAPPLTMLWDLVVAPPHILAVPMEDLHLTSVVIAVDAPFTVADPPPFTSAPLLLDISLPLVTPISSVVLPILVPPADGPPPFVHPPTLVDPPTVADPPWCFTWNLLWSLCSLLALVVDLVDPPWHLLIPWLHSFLCFLVTLTPWFSNLICCIPYQLTWFIPWLNGWPPTYLSFYSSFFILLATLQDPLSTLFVFTGKLPLSCLINKIMQLPLGLCSQCIIVDLGFDFWTFLVTVAVVANGFWWLLPPPLYDPSVLSTLNFISLNIPVAFHPSFITQAINFCNFLFGLLAYAILVFLVVQSGGLFGVVVPVDGSL